MESPPVCFRHPFELKLEIVNFVIEGKHSYKQASQKYHIHQGTNSEFGVIFTEILVKMVLKPQKLENMMEIFKVSVVEYMYANHLSFLKRQECIFKLPSSTIIVLWKQNV